MFQKRAHGESGSAKEDAVGLFREELNKIINDEGLLLGQVYNFDHQLRDLETKLAATRQAIDSFCDGGLEPPPPSLVDSLSSLSRKLVDARRISSDLHGANRPPSQRPGVSSHRQRFAAAAARPSVSWRQPYAFAPGQPTSNSSGRSFRPRGDSPPHKRRRLPVEIRLMSTILCRPPATGMSTILCRSPATGRRGG